MATKFCEDCVHYIPPPNNLGPDVARCAFPFEVMPRPIDLVARKVDPDQPLCVILRSADYNAARYCGKEASRYEVKESADV